MNVYPEFRVLTKADALDKATVKWKLLVYLSKHSKLQMVNA